MRILCGMHDDMFNRLWQCTTVTQLRSDRVSDRVVRLAAAAEWKISAKELALFTEGVVEPIRVITSPVPFRKVVHRGIATRTRLLRNLTGWPGTFFFD